MHRLLALVLIASATTLSACATASAANPDTEIKTAAMIITGSPLDERVQQLDALFKGQLSPEDYFAQSFLDAIPPAQIKAVFDGLIAQHGQPMYPVSSGPRGATGATIQYAFERGIATIELDIAAAAPSKVIGLAITGVSKSDDSVDKIADEIDLLPGQTGYLVAELDGAGNTRTLVSRYTDRQLAIGSTFKLYILAELAAQVKSGARKWSDVAPLSQRSFSSAGTSGWPKDSPMTLHSLASMMISLSDNSATDTLLFALGREAVEKRLAIIGHSAPDKTLPFLSTVEAFALKANQSLRERFLKASEATQRHLLMSEAAALALDKIDNAQLSKGPSAIDTVEWFASADDILWLMNHIRAQQNDDMMAIMGINPGISPAAVKRWRYVGYKGGSEPGVISMSYLLHSKSGKWYVATGSWNDTTKEVENNKFAALMERMVSAIPD
jgi:beta-lactamase class A/predicted small secreted protein